MKADIAIKNGAIADERGVYEADVAVKDGIICSVSKKGTLPPARRVINAEGLYVMPGVIDPHVHIGYPDWPFIDDCRATTMAAASGGVTTIIHYLIHPKSLVAAAEKRAKEFEANSYVDGSFHALIYFDEHIREIPSLFKQGITSFKFYLPYRGEAALPPYGPVDDGLVYCAFQEIAKLPPPALALVHAENIEIYFKLKKRLMESGRNDATWSDARPAFIEEEAMRRMAFLAKAASCPLYIIHMSIGAGVRAIEEARASGSRIYSETCPHYLALTGKSLGALGKVDPPLREAEDCAKLWEGIGSGRIDCIGSDHASSSFKHKRGGLFEALSGFAGVETLLPVMLSEGVNAKKISIEKLVEVCCANPARIFGLYPRKGAIRVGSDADIVLVDPGAKSTIKAEKLHHISDFTPFEGLEVRGLPVLTMIRGKVVMEAGEIVAPCGYGRFLRRG